MPVKENLQHILSSLPSAVTLVAVSKTKPDALILEAYAAGQRDFGENYVQELVDKQARLPADIRWHFIGHLQSNKVKYIAPFVHLIHGVDSLKLLAEISKQAEKNQRTISCLLQVHIAKEDTKFGFSMDECLDAFHSGMVSSYKHVRVVGLMGMASNSDNEAIVRAEFRGLKTCFDAICAAGHALRYLSMGMSGDYPIAIEEGSNMVRIGSSIFGERLYPGKPAL